MTSDDSRPRHPAGIDVPSGTAVDGTGRTVESPYSVQGRVSTRGAMSVIDRAIEPAPDPEPPDPDPEPPMSDNTDSTPIKLTVEATPADGWPADMVRSEEDIRKIVREMDLGGGSDIDPTRLSAAEARLDRLEELIHDLNTDEGVSEERVRDLIKEGTPDPSRISALESAIQNLTQTVEGLESRPDGEGAPDDLVEELRQRVRELTLVSNPDTVRRVARGAHEDEDYHPYGAWGIVVTPERDVHWREADVHPETDGEMLLEVFGMEYEPDETYEVGERLNTQELSLTGQRHTVYPDITLNAGETYFITRDAENPAGDDVVPLKRGGRDVDWDGLTGDVPITIHCSWQLGRGGPGTQSFADYREAGWHRTLHHWRECVFGYMEE